MFQTTNKFSKDNPDIIIVRADKGNITVALDKSNYKNEILFYFFYLLGMLQDCNTYEVVNKDPTKRLTNNVRVLFTRQKDKKCITTQDYKNMYCSDGILPRAYGLPKIHKPGSAFRIIISSIDSLLYLLASAIQKIITQGITKTFSRIDNSFQLANKFNGMHINDTYCLISLSPHFSQTS